MSVSSASSFSSFSSSSSRRQPSPAPQLNITRQTPTSSSHASTPKNGAINTRTGNSYSNSNLDNSNTDGPDPDYPGLSGELLQLTKFPFSYVRKAVRAQVDDALWLDNLQQVYAELERRKSMKHDDNLERCLICTLPHGTCRHTKAWVQEQENKAIEKFVKNELDQEIDDVLGVLGGTSLDSDLASSADKDKVKEKEARPTVNLDSLKWYQLEQRFADTIGSDFFCVHQPTPRGWHTTTLLMNRFIVVFGGVRFRGNEIPQPFSSTPKAGEFEVMDKMFVYDTLQLSWHVREGKGTIGAKPYPRFGHVACALDENRMMIFGGRGGPSNRCLNDTWVYTFTLDKWDQINVGIRNPSGKSILCNNDALLLLLLLFHYFFVCFNLYIEKFIYLFIFVYYSLIL